MRGSNRPRRTPKYTESSVSAGRTDNGQHFSENPEGIRTVDRIERDRTRTGSRQRTESIQTQSGLNSDSRDTGRTSTVLSADVWFEKSQSETEDGPNCPNLTDNPFCSNVHDPLLGIIFSSFSIYFVRFLDFFDLWPFFRARDKSSINKTAVLNYF